MQLQSIPTGAIPCNMYVDAENIRIPLRQANLPDEFDPTRLRPFVESQQLGNRPLFVVRTYFYETVYPFAPEDERDRERQYLQGSVILIQPY